ncbi:---NA---, partial [Olea europaea subsp. europaea]
MTPTQIAAHPDVHVSLTTVKRLIRRYDAGGYNARKDKPKSRRRPKATTAEQDADIVASVGAQPSRAASSVVAEIHPQLGAASKMWTVRR